MKISSTSGDFKVISKHAEIIKKKKGLVGKLWKIVKGQGVSRAKIQTVGGNVKASIGDEE